MDAASLICAASVASATGVVTWVWSSADCCGLMPFFVFAFFALLLFLVLMFGLPLSDSVATCS